MDKIVSPRWFYWRNDSLFLHVYIQPRASKDKVVGPHDDCLKIRLTAPATEGQANKYLIKLLACTFEVREQQIKLIKGELNRKKWVQIDSPQNVSILNESCFSK